jgi:hypothetical protein
MKFYKVFLILVLLEFCGEVVAQDNSNERSKYYPVFSWETVPVAFHFGNSDSLMSQKEAKFVATRSNFICLEKGHANGQFGNTEEGIQEETQRLQKLNPNMKVIFYWNTFLDYPMFQAHEEYEQHPEWWLTTKDGKLDVKNGRLKRYDLSNSEVRNWWTDVAQKAVKAGSSDGIFMDAFPQIVSEKNKELWGNEKYEAIQKGLKDIIEQTREKIGSDKLIVYNGIRSTPQIQIGYDFPEHTDAIMIEHFGQFNSASKESMLLDIREMEKAGKNGKIVVFKGWPGFTFIDKEAMEKPWKEKRRIAEMNIIFPLASFLVGAQENCYFVYSWGYRMDNGCLEWYPELDKKLGNPLGDAKQTNWTLKRNFEKASVWVNLETRDANIEWKE